MYLSFNRTLVAGGKLDWPAFARLAHYAGYRGVDVEAKPAMEAGLEATRSLLGGSSLKPAVIGLPVNFREDQAQFEQDMKGLPAVAEFAAALGCPRITTWLLPSSPLPKAEQRAIYKVRFQAIAEVLARHQVRFGLEFVSPVHLRKRHPYEFIWRMDEMLEFARECGPNVGLLLDSWHWHHAEGTLADIEAAGVDAIVHVQLADAPDLPPEMIVDSERLMPGEGVIDLVGFFRTLKKIGYADGVSPEVFGRGLKEMSPEQGALLGWQTSTAVMEKAGVL
jgi:sugar phosphate isomerase/epimerase